MTHQYESEILNKLMERDGFNIPSSVPPYEAEIKAYLINQVKQAYPKLTDYEAEWLLYNYTKHLPADFPISSVSNVTDASFENVVPFAYQSAILKGQTLVNLFKNKDTHRDTGKFIYVEDGDKIQATFKDGVTYGWLGFSFKENVPFEIGKTYTVMNELYKCDDQLNSFNISFGNKTFSNTNPVIGINKLKITIPSDYTEGINWAYYSVNNTNNSATIFSSNLLILEGDYTQEDIPYFDGMKSVQMPVLTTTGKNLFDMSEIVMSDFEQNKYQNGYYGKEIQLQPNTTYTIKPYLISEITNTNVWTVFNLVVNGVKTEVVNANYTGSGADKKAWNTQTFETDETGVVCYSIYCHKNKEESWFGNLPIEVQLEEGSTATPYEPFKSNILTVNEEVELRGVNGVKDELDLLTGELTQRIGEVVLDGSESWVNKESIMVTKTNTIGFYMDNNGKHAVGAIISDNLREITDGEMYSGDVEGINSFQGNIRIRIAKNKLLTQNVAGFKQYLSQNPITVQYHLATESIKTVDLKTVNETGESIHFMPLEGTMNVQSSGETIQPTFDMAVPVEATTQNLASFIDLEMEE